jgi:hypothetical protein
VLLSDRQVSSAEFTGLELESQQQFLSRLSITTRKIPSLFFLPLKNGTSTMKVSFSRKYKKSHRKSNNARIIKKPFAPNCLD